jgi:hypothetical protein
MTYEDARGTTEARNALDETLRHATRWVPLSLPDEGRELIGGALQRGAQLHIELRLPTGEAQLFIEIESRRLEVMKVVLTPLSS